MSLSNCELSAADVAAVTGNNGFGGFGDGSFWIIVLFLFALMGGWNNGFNGGGAQPAVQQGFDQAAVMGQLGQINSSITSGFAGAEASANARQIADMQQAFDGLFKLFPQALGQGVESIGFVTQHAPGFFDIFHALQTQFANCCCENRLATANLAADIAREACADRQAVSDALASTLNTMNAGIQSLKDQMCQDKIDAKNEQIANLRQQMAMMQLNASQNAQTQALIANNELQTAALEQYLAPTPRPAYVVQNPNCCAQNYYNGCGCGM